MSTEPTLITETAQAVEASGGLGTLGINLKIFIAQLVNFLVVLLVLWKWAYRPIVKTLESRRERVEKSLKDAEAIEVRLSTLEQERKTVIAQANVEATALIEKAREDAEARDRETVEKARREVERVVAQGKGQLKNEKEAMLREARKEMVEIALEAVRKILKQTVDEKKSKSLAEEVVRKMT